MSSVTGVETDGSKVTQILPASESAQMHEIKRLRGLLKQYMECLFTVKEGTAPSRIEIKNRISTATPEIAQEECEEVIQIFIKLAEVATRYVAIREGIKDLNSELVDSTDSLKETHMRF